MVREQLDKLGVPYALFNQRGFAGMAGDNTDATRSLVRSAWALSGLLGFPWSSLIAAETGSMAEPWPKG